VKGPRIFASRLAFLAVTTGLFAALSSVALAPAQDPRPDTARHVMLVPDTPEGQAALARTDARVVAGYDAFALVEATGADEQRLRAAGGERRDDMRTVTTAAGEIDPADDRRSLAGKEAPDRDETLALVQFIGPPKDAWLGRLRRTGARVVTYQAQNSYVVHARGDVVDRLATLVGSDPAVRAVSVLTAADKLEGSRSGASRWAVSTVSGDAGADARSAAAGAGSAVGAPSTVGELRTQYLALSPAEAAELARAPAVVAVEPYAEPELLDERAAQIVAGNLVAPGYLSWLVNPARVPNQSTFDFAIDVTDEGLDNGDDPSAHPDFRVQGSVASRLAYRNNHTGDANTRDCGGHGTNVASIAAGYNDAGGATYEDSEGFNYGMGVAPFAQIGVSKIFSCTGTFTPAFNPTTATTQAYAGGARISNNSWGSGAGFDWGNYSARAAQYDELVREAGPEGMVEVFAAGNDGEGIDGNFNEGYATISEEASAKNVITVGASESVRASGLDGCNTPNSGADNAGDIVDFSSRGPTDDGRLKPDLVAPGTHVTGAAPQHPGYDGSGTCNPSFGSAFYSLISGSSQAAPQVSGAAALIRRWYRQTHPAPPSPALTKALLLNTATDLAGGNNGKGDTIAGGPNTDQGWGRVNVGTTFDSTVRELHDQDDLLGSSGDSTTRTYEADAAGKPVRVTLAWTDAPGPGVGKALVNDLDLVVEAGGQTYKGNVFSGSYSRTGGTRDSRNNVESVYLPAGVADELSVSVEGIAIGADGVPGQGDSTDQDYALVVSNADEQDVPVLVHEGTDIVDGDGDGFIESDESFELTETVRNAGSAPALPGVGTLRSSGLDPDEATSLYPLITDGSQEANAIPFAADVPNAARCGADIPATLELAGGDTIPLTLPTGETGPVTGDDSSAVPRAIPDDSATGVTSQLFVPDPGRIKDLNMRIGELRHGWIGDLVIDLTGPDGTTVRLVEHPGGPDNGGKDLMNVTFDDEASATIGTGGLTGSVKPQNDELSRFDGKQRQGVWTLRVRDLFEGDVGTVRAWGTSIGRAVCDVDTVAPDTNFGTGPATSSNSRSAGFTFGSGDSQAYFECRLDGGPWSECAAPKSYSGLADGSHSFEVRAVDGSGNADSSPAAHNWTIDATPPDTAISSAPPGYTALTTASFSFSGSEPGLTFRCRLDGGGTTPCGAPQGYSGLGEGQHSFTVEAVDALGNVDPSPATHTWTVDRTAPALRVTSPSGVTADTTPTVSGVGGTSAGDTASVTFRLYRGSAASGSPEQTLVVPRASNGAWSAVPAALGEGTWSVRAEQSDAAGNVGRSAAASFRVSVPATFVAAPAEEGLADALGGRYSVLAACGAACKVKATLSASSREKQPLGSASTRLSKAGAATVRVRVRRRARAALSRRSTATLRVTLTEGETKVTLRRTVALRRSAGPALIARRGLHLWTACSKSCPLSGQLTISASAARKLRIRRGVASGKVTGGTVAKRLTLTVPRSSRRALRRARSLAGRLKLTAGASGDPVRSATRTLKLRR
jgi:subtilisin-like proprotein convertase family protein